MPIVATTEATVRARANAGEQRPAAPRESATGADGDHGRCAEPVDERPESRPACPAGLSRLEHPRGRSPRGVEPRHDREDGHQPEHECDARSAARSGSSGRCLRGVQERRRRVDEDRCEEAAEEQAGRDADRREPELLDEQDAGDLAGCQTCGLQRPDLLRERAIT